MYYESTSARANICAWLTAETRGERSAMADELERDIQSAEREFLVEALTDDEIDDAGATDEDDIEFDEQLEIAGEITLRTGSASSDDEVVDFLANGCGCTKLANGPCS